MNVEVSETLCESQFLDWQGILWSGGFFSELVRQTVIGHVCAMGRINCAQCFCCLALGRATTKVDSHIAKWGSAINSVNYKALAHRSRKVCLLKHPES